MTEVVEVSRDIGMVRPEAVLVNGQSAAINQFGLSELVGGMQQCAQVVEVFRDVGMVRPEPVLI